MLLDLQNHSLCTEYDQFVEQSPYGNLLQSRAWARVKTNWDAAFLYLRRSGVIVASLSLLSIYDQKVGQRFFYVPRGPVVNPEDRESLREILQEALCYAREHDGFLLRVEPNLLDTKENRELSKSLGLPLERHRAFCSQPPLSSILDLGGRSMDEIFDDYSKNTRRNIRSAYRHGLELYIGGRKDLPTFYQLIQDMSRMKGLGHRPYSYFESIYEALGERVSLYFSLLPSELRNQAIAYGERPAIQPIYERSDHQVLAGSLAVRYGDTLYSLYGADPVYHCLGQSYLLDYEELRLCHRLGCRYYDMGGLFSADPNDKLTSFKLRFTQQGLYRWLSVWEFTLNHRAYETWCGYQKHEKQLRSLLRRQRASSED